MVRLWIHPDGSVTETVYVREDAETVARVNAVLSARWPLAEARDYSNDDYDAVKPRTPEGDVERTERWRWREGRLVADRTVPAPMSLRDRVEALERRLP